MELHVLNLENEDKKSFILLFMLIQWTLFMENNSFLCFSFVEIWCTDRLRCQQYSTLPWGFTASAVRMLSLICWTMCGQTFLRRPLTLCRLSWAPLKAWGWELVQARFYNMPYRWGLLNNFFGGWVKALGGRREGLSLLTNEKTLAVMGKFTIMW